MIQIKNWILQNIKSINQILQKNMLNKGIKF